jgi:hypothetical protein
VVQAAIDAAECFPDEFDSAVWYTMMEPKLRRIVKDPRRAAADPEARVLRSASPGAEAAARARAGGDRRREPLQSLGRVLGRRRGPDAGDALLARGARHARHQLTRVEDNIRMGCAILRFYLQREKNDVRRALARYNGSVGRRGISDMVVGRWTRWNGADDLGMSKVTSTR